jgi:hypothetical protein
MKAAASWQSCPRCLAKEKVNVPLSFELGWRAAEQRADVRRLAHHHSSLSSSASA